MTSEQTSPGRPDRVLSVTLTGSDGQPQQYMPATVLIDVLRALSGIWPGASVHQSPTTAGALVSLSVTAEQLDAREAAHDAIGGLDLDDVDQEKAILAALTYLPGGYVPVRVDDLDGMENPGATLLARANGAEELLDEARAMAS